MLKKLESALPGEDLDAEKSFLEHRYGAHLRNYRSWGGWYNLAFTFGTLVVVASGVLTSSIGAGWRSTHWAKIALLVFGLMTAVVSALHHLWRPGRKGTARIRGANRLSSEGWAFLEGVGRYRDVDDGQGS